MSNELRLKNISEADINYNYKDRIETRLKGLLADKDISKRNKDFIMQFLKYCSNEGLSNARISFYVDKLKIMALILKKDFDKCERKDIEKFIAEINNRYDKAESRRAYIVTLKKFFRVIRNEEKPELISWIKTKNYERTALKQNESNRIDNILTPEEVEKIINEAKTPRDRALIGMLYYSAGRLGELISLKIKDIEFEDYRTLVKLYGKTGARKVPINECSKLIQSWLEFHPDKNNKEAYVWISFNDLNRINNLNKINTKQEDIKLPIVNSSEHIGIRYIEKLIKEIGSKAGITKRLNPHNFRHSRLTQLGLMGVDEDMIKLYAGHSKNSRITSQYKHYSYNNLVETMDKLHGFSKEEKNVNEMLKCYRCGWINRNTISVCENCGLSLNVKETGNISKDKRKQISLNKIMKVLLEDDIFKKFLARYLIDKNMVNYAKQLAEEEK